MQPYGVDTVIICNLPRRKLDAQSSATLPVHPQPGFEPQGSPRAVSVPHLPHVWCHSSGRSQAGGRGLWLQGPVGVLSSQPLDVARKLVFSQGGRLLSRGRKTVPSLPHRCWAATSGPLSLGASLLIGPTSAASPSWPVSGQGDRAWGNCHTSVRVTSLEDKETLETHTALHLFLLSH